MLQRRDAEHAELLHTVETLEDELRRAKTRPTPTEAKPLAPSSPIISAPAHAIERTEHGRMVLGRDTTVAGSKLPIPETKPPPKTTPTPKTRPTTETKLLTPRTMSSVSTKKPLSRPVDAKPTPPRTLDLFKPSLLSFRPITIRKPLDLKVTGPRSTPVLAKPVITSTPVASSTQPTPTTTPTVASEPRRLFPSHGTPELPATSGRTLLGLKRKAGDLSLPKPKFSFGKARLPKAP
ncbi:hypothetical protein SPRG_22293 [Saprolegnia parasitica CBS 223.65]|uniref:Uncharacterized protein n=1 Tax=Saprolegnia parasitica (strain CBS 223.65) TaxID=695850 RepID=A0A067C878_SAPPC|nr:hypothetical protein SPRG_22293 [Saprolegnia parasitica CBS 223.65]KDO22726.1 hypothetical protein SPRG_22293 [Saprolegnia parasitica CBS 223.65]|eukprot:XP_012206571.1 hypothetical protein SPRG_22293 [Saprolegnia parasitica CBS 223.65]